MRRIHLLLALSATFTAAPASAQDDSVESRTFGLIIGSDDRETVNNDWIAAHPGYAHVVDAVGHFATKGMCTATYVGGGIAVSAGHCVKAGASELRNWPCDRMTIAWKFRADQPKPYPRSKCRRILAAKKLLPYDYLFMEIAPFPTSEVRAIHNAGSGMGVTSPGVMFSHPRNLSLRYSGSCRLPPYGTGIAHDCDSDKGSSGALILEQSTRHAVAIHYGDSGGSNSALYLGHTPLGELMDARFAPKGKLVSVDAKCLDLRGASRADRTSVELRTCALAESQTWSLTPYRAIVGPGRKCLDIPYATMGTGPWLFTCHYGQNQMWGFPEFEIRIGASLCLDVPGVNPANFTRAQIWTCHGGDGQKWSWTDKLQIRNKQGRCLDAMSFNPRNGTPVVVHDCHDGANQIWDIGGYGAVVGIGRLCLDVTNRRLRNGTSVQLHDCDRGTGQVFTLRGVLQPSTGGCLGPNQDHPPEGAAVTLAACTGIARQIWEYIP